MDLDQNITLTHEKLKEATFGIRSLSQEQREAVRAKLAPQVGHTLYARELKRILHELREEHAISQIDAEAVLESFFGG